MERILRGCKDSVQKLIKYLVLKRVHTKVGFSIVSAAEPHTAYAVIVAEPHTAYAVIVVGWAKP